MPTTASPFSTGQGICHGDRGLEIVTKEPRDANAWVGLHGDAIITLWQCHFCGLRDSRGRHYLFSPSGIQDPPALLHLQRNSQVRNAPQGQGGHSGRVRDTMAGSGDMLVGLERNVQAGFEGTPAQLRDDMLSLYTESPSCQLGLGGTHC